MISHILISFLITIFCNDSVEPEFGIQDPCSIFGSIYVTNDVRKANYRVYVEDSELNSDLVVFKEDNKLMANKEGLWYETGNIGFAQYAIYYEGTEAHADFSVYFTEVPAFAGCN